MNINKKLAANSNIKHYPSFASPKDGPPTSLTSKSFFIPRVSIRAIDASVIPTSYAATYRIILGNEIKLEVHNPKETRGFTFPPEVSIVQNIINPKMILCENATAKIEAGLLLSVD